MTEQSTNDAAATEDREDDHDDEHLAGLDPGAGCTEIWEHLSEYREREEE